MKLQWKKLLVKTTLWLATEIILNVVGLDNLADYSEFIYEQDAALLGYLNQPAIVMPSL
jgi:preprotein translocase subunit SecG